MVLSAALALIALAPNVGLKPGDSVSPFEPMHVSGPYAGVRQCPVCEWSFRPMVFIWVNQADEVEVRRVAEAVQAAVATVPERRVKAFLVDANGAGKDAASQATLEKWAKAWNVPDVYFMSRLGSMKASLKDYKLEPLNSWKVQIYTVKSRKVVARFETNQLEALATSIAEVGQK